MSEATNFINEIWSYERIISFLEAGKDARGNKFSLNRFLRYSHKGLEYLYYELNNRDVVLMYHPLNGTIIRCARSVKVIFRNILQGYELVEVKRIHPNGKSTLSDRSLGNWTIRETRKPDELAITAALRGCQEEKKVYIPANELKPLIPKLFNSQEIHKSSVYYGIYSLVSTEWFEWVTTEFPCNKPDTIEDENTVIELEPSLYLLAA